MNKVLFIFALFSFLPWVSEAQIAKPDSSKRVKFAGIPIINYNKTMGFTAGAMLSFFYKMNTKDTLSPTTSTGFIGVYTTNKTYFALVYHRMYLKQDKWRIQAAVGTGSLYFQYYQDIPIWGGGTFVDFNTSANFAYSEVKRKVYKKLYGGIHATASKATTVYDVEDPKKGSNIESQLSMNNMGYIVSYDTRNHQMGPSKGINFNWKHSFFEKWMGSTYEFGKLDISCTKFICLKEDGTKILVARATTTVSYGNVPFQGQNVVSGDDIRGYSNGRYRDNAVYTMQTEYRWNFYKRFGAVGFIGVATITDKVSNFSGMPFLPGAGVGVRYKMIPSERINVGLDVAVGKEDWGIYFRIGEAFNK